LAHNLGALPAAASAAKISRVPFAFDMEDYHAGETLNATENQLRALLLKKLLFKASFVTCASPGIKQALLELFPDPPYVTETINNVFPQTEFIPPPAVSGKLKLVWFSQTISFQRGLESIIQAIIPFADQVELHLIGKVSDEFHKVWIKPYTQIVMVHEPLEQSELHKQLGWYDIGLALELNNIEHNRDICLTNKIWAYLQAGLYILASNTSAQNLFLQQFPNHGQILMVHSDSQNTLIQELILQKDTIRDARQQRSHNAARVSWEFESIKLLKLVENTLKKG
jgi:hypothetical protein